MIYAPLSVAYFVSRVSTLPDVQGMIFMRLMFHIAANQQWLPLDRVQCLGIAQARASKQIQAFDRVMEEHFVITDEGRKPRDMAAFTMLGRVQIVSVPVSHPVTTPPSGTVTKQLLTRHSNNDRQKRSRAERSSLVTQAYALGHSPRTRATIQELRDLIAVTDNGHNGVTNPGPTVTRARARADLEPQYQIQRQDTKAGAARAQDQVEHGEVRTVALDATAYGRAAMGMKAAGMAQVNPSHPEFRALVDAGAGQELADAAAEAVAIGKGFAYVLATVRGRRADAAAKGAVAASRQDDGFVSPAFLAKLRGSNSQ